MLNFFSTRPDHPLGEAREFKRVLASPRKKANRESAGEHGDGNGTPPAEPGPKPS